MSEIKHFLAKDLHVSETRQRRFFDGAKIIELANSIQSIGLLQPLVVAYSGQLIAGERRLRAIRHLSTLGITVHCGSDDFPPGEVPCIYFGEDSTPLKAWEAELDENIRREDLTWQEKAAATEALHALRTAQDPTHSVADTAMELHKRVDGSFHTGTRDAILVSRHLEDKEVSSAPTLKDAIKVLKKREEKARLTKLSANVNVKTLSSLHSLHLGDFRAVDLPSNSIDVILTDPPYGMGAEGFHDGGDASTVLHQYEDQGGEAWEDLMVGLAAWSWRVTKEQAHAYIFCDIDKFAFLRGLFTTTGWWVHRTPLVYSKSHASSRRVPWPEHGPRRSYELVLYAVKGKKRVNCIKSDVFGPYSTDENLGHAAQKPVELYTDLLARSVAAGDTVIDPFAGTGTIFPAAQECRCRAIGIELDPSFHGMAVERLEKLR
jgi:site-specific DNA-methyltransferase (adenine-specific)